MKQKRISDTGTQQLLIDTYSVKTIMLQLQHLGLDPKAKSKPTIPTMYLKLVNGKVAHIEMILKLLATPEEMLLERFKIMWPDGQPSDLQTLMSIKGTKRNDQQVILEMLGLSAAGKMLNKTASTIFTAGATNSPNMPAAAGSAGSGGSTYSAAAAASISMASSSMGRLTQDLSSSARNAVGNLKWTSK